MLWAAGSTLTALIAAAIAEHQRAKAARESAQYESSQGRMALSPEKPEPPRDFDPEVAKSISGNTPPSIGGNVELPPVPGFMPSDHDDLVTIFPDQSGELPQLIIVERTGSPRTRQFNSDIAWIINYLAPQLGGGFDRLRGDWNRKKKKYGEEPYLRPNHKELGDAGFQTEGRQGGSYIDVGFQNIVTKRRLLINTIDVRADGITPSTREQNAAIRIVINAARGDILVLIPKLRTEETIDLDAMEAFLRPLMEEISRPFREGNPYSNRPYGERRYLYRPGQ